MTAPDPYDLNTWPPEAVDRLWAAVRDTGQQTYICPDCGTEATCADPELLTLYGSRHMTRCTGREPAQSWKAGGYAPFPPLTRVGRWVAALSNAQMWFLILVASGVIWIGITVGVGRLVRAVLP